MKNNTLPVWLAALLLLLCCLISSSALCRENALETVTIQFKWFHQFQFAGYYAAKEKGFYAEEGLDVVFKELAPGKSSIQSVLDGTCQYGVSDAGLILQRAQGKPVVLLAQIFQHTPLVLLTKKESNITSPFEMVGKKVMFGLQDDVHAPITAMFLETIGDLSSIQQVPHSLNHNDLVSGKVDAIVAYLSNQPFQYKKQNVEVNIINPQSYGVDFYGDNLFTTDTEIIDHPQRVEKMIRASLKGWQYALDNPEEIIDLIIEKYRPELAREQLRYEAKIIPQMIMPDIIPIGEVNPVRYLKVNKVYAQLGHTAETEIPDGFIFKDGIRKPQIHLTEDEKAWLDAHPEITLGGSIFAPLDFKDESGRITGIATDYTRLIADILGIEFTLITGELHEIQRMARERKIDGVRFLARNEKREEYLHFSKPYFPLQFAILTADNPEAASSLAELSNSRVGTMKGSLAHYYLQRHYPEIQLVLFTSSEDILNSLVTGDTTAIVGPLAVINHYINKLFITGLQITALLPEMERQGHIGIRKDWPELTALLDKALDSITPEQHRRIKSKWLVADSADFHSPFSLTSLEKEWLSEHRKIRLGIDSSWPPFEYFDSAGEYQGLSSSYVQMINELLDVDMRPAKTSSWDEVLKMAREGKVDILSSVMKSEKRSKYLNFTKPHTLFPLVIVTPDDGLVKGLDDLKGRRVATINGYITEEMLQNDFPDFQYIGFDNIDLALHALSEGMVDAFVGNPATISYATKKLGLDNLVVAAPIDYRFELSFGVRKDWPELIPILNRFIDSLSPQEKRAIEQGWLNLRVQKQTDWSAVWIFGGVVTVFFTLLLSISLLWNRKLSQEIVKRKEAEVFSRKTEKDLKEREIQLSLAINSAGLGTWDWNIQTGAVIFNHLWARMIGYSLEEIEQNVKTWEALLHPEDQPFTMSALYANLEGKIFFYENEHRLLTKSGRWKWFLAMGKVVEWDESGNPIRHVGVCFDIDERKSIETEREKLLHALGERVKELNGLYHISSQLQDPHSPTGTILQNIVNFIPSSWQHPSLTCARIILDNKSYTTKYFRKTPWRQQSDIKVNEKKSGSVEVYYTEEVAENDEGPFSKEERNLINSIAEQLGVFFEFKLSEQSLREREEQLRTIVENSPVAMVMVDNNGNILSFNNKFTQSFGYTIDDVSTAEEWWETAYPNEDYRETVSKKWEAAVAKSQSSGEEIKTQTWELTCKDGTVRICEFNMVPLSELSVITINDITHRKRSEENLKKSRKEAEEATKKAKAANRAKSLFLANMSHELRTPLSAIIGFANLLRRDPSISKTHHSEIDSICRSGNHLLTLINEVLDISRIEAGRLSLTLTSIDLSLFIHDIVEMVIHRARAKGLQFNLDIHKNCPSHIKADEGKVRQILINLLGNSVKFTDQGKISLQVKRKGQDNNTICFEIADTGVGISQKYATKIFDPFVQGNTDDGQASGVGLGLAISSRLISLMGGTITLESEIGIGTEFTVELPVEIIDDEKITISREPRRVVKLAPNQPQYRILIVEDSDDNRILLKKMLTKVGFEVRDTINGKEGVELFQEWHPHLIWMDMRMDVMDGFEATQKIKEMQQTKQKSDKSVIIALTAHAFEEERQKMLAAGCDDFIRKPFEEKEIYDSMAKHLGVEFLYDQEWPTPDSKPSALVKKPLKIDLHNLPKQLQDQLASAVLDLNMKKTYELIEQINSLDESAGVALYNLADEFEFDRIIEIIGTTAKQ